MNIPKAFISYSHDSQEHKKWVLDLATRLMNTGVDVVVDLWELQPGDDIPHFMEKHMTACDHVIMVCTEKYVKKADSGVGGVGYEKMIVTADLMKEIDSRKVIPIIRQKGTRDVPTFLKSKLFIDFSKTDDYELSFDDLTRALLKSPLYKKPKIGNNPFEPVENIRPSKTSDGLKKLMILVVRSFEQGENYFSYEYAVQIIGMSRIMLDMLIDEAVEDGLLSLDDEGDLVLTKKGKFYAIEHKIVGT